MTLPQDDLLNTISQYLDDELTPAQRADFQPHLADNPDTQAALDHLRHTQSRLADLYAATETPTTFKLPSQPRRLAPLIAAMLLIAAAAWFIIPTLTPKAPPLQADAIHAAFVLNQTPSVVCDTPEKFLDYTTQKLDEPIAANFDTPLTLIGWRGTGIRYDSSTDSVDPRVLLATTPDSTPIVVIFQPSRSPQPTITANPALHAFSKKLGSITAWEISPKEAPEVLTLLTRAKK